MKILLIHNYYRERGGEDVYVDNLFNLLRSNGNKVEIFSKKSSAASFSKKITIAKNLIFGNQKIKKELETLIKTFKPDIIHIHNIYPLITNSIFDTLQYYKIPIVQTIHNYRLLGSKGTKFTSQKPNKIKWYANSYTATLALTLNYIFNRKKDLSIIDTFIFPNNFLQKIFITKLEIPFNKTTVIPHFAFSTDTKKVIKKRDYFLFVGRISEEKGIESLIKIFNHFPRIPLIIVGTGPLSNELRKISKSNVRFVGFKSGKELNEFYLGAIATIIPSVRSFETGPLVLIESYANKTPVIVPQSGVFVEKVKEDKTGFFYTPENINELQEKIINVYKKRNNLQQLQQYSYREYLNNYTSAIHYKNLIKIYKSLL